MAQAQSAQQFGFRVIVRGSDAKGKRVRRVHTVKAPSFEAVYNTLEQTVEKTKLTQGLRDVYCNVFVPLTK